MLINCKCTHLWLWRHNCTWLTCIDIKNCVIANEIQHWRIILHRISILNLLGNCRWMKYCLNHSTNARWSCEFVFGSQNCRKVFPRYSDDNTNKYRKHSSPTLWPYNDQNVWRLMSYRTGLVLVYSTLCNLRT